jgi:uncharacterized membrane protein YdbT with pleckstrin-like domain
LDKPDRAHNARNSPVRRDIHRGHVNPRLHRFPLANLAYILLLLPFASIVRKVLIWENHLYCITNHRVLQVWGVFNKFTADSSLEKVNDVKMEQSFWGRVLNFGDINVLTASETGIDRLENIHDPIRFKTTMMNAKQNLDRGSNEKDIPALINELAQLRQQGILTETEFQQKKTELLKKI